MGSPEIEKHPTVKRFEVEVITWTSTDTLKRLFWGGFGVKCYDGAEHLLIWCPNHKKLQLCLVKLVF